MITLLPVFLLIFATIFLQIMGRVRYSPGRTWLIASIVVIAVFISMILIRLLMPSGWVINNWLPEVESDGLILFKFTKETWVYGFLLVTLLTAIVFYEARFLELGGYLNLLTGTLLLGAFGLTAVASGNGLTFLLTWVLVDVVEFAMLVWMIKDVKRHQISVISLLLRILGTILLVLYLALHFSDGSATTETAAVSGVLVIAISILRMGIIPLHLPYSEEIPIRRGMGSLLRFIPILSVLSFITLFQPQDFTSSALQGLLTIFTLGAIFGSFSWFFSKDELSGRPYWVFAFGCLILIGYMRGSIDGMVALSIVMLTIGSGLFLFTSRQRKNLFYLPLLFVGLLALPYTPSALIPQAIWGSHFAIADIFLMLSFSLLLGGGIRHALRRKVEQKQIEDWVWLFQLLGLIFIALAPWIIEIFDFKKVKNYQNWWILIPLLTLTGLFVLLNYVKFREESRIANGYRKIKKLLGPLVLFSDKFFQFNWLVRIFEIISSFLAYLINLLVRVLEGDGGILWSFLFLVLLASLLISGQVP